jgi:tetratricopeptide (TPR) repeat protein
MRERIIRDVIERMLTDTEYLRIIQQTPIRALGAYGLAEEADSAEQRDVAADADHDDEPPGATCEPLDAAMYAIAAGAADPLAFIRRGAALQCQGDPSSAARDYSRAIEQGAELPAETLAATYAGRGACLWSLGDIPGAIADAERAVMLAPNCARHHASLGRARLCAGDLSDALADLNRALALDPYDPRARAYRGRCCQALGQHQRALADFGQLLATGAGSYRILIDRAQSYIALGNLGLALIDCEIAERQLADGDDNRVYQLRGYVLYRIGDMYGALRDLSRAIGCADGPADAFLWRGLTYHALGDSEAASADLAAFALRHPAGAAPAIRAIVAELGVVTQDQWAMLAA